MTKILMCEPKYFEISYKINPWMRIGESKHDLAVKQWQRLVELIQQCGAEIRFIEPVKGLPDMVFTANACLRVDDLIIMSHFKYPERQAERAYYAQWFKASGYTLMEDEDDSLSFEGAGDALWMGKRLFVGYGFRTDKAYYEKLSHLPIKDLVMCELVDPHFYHLDTCFCPINNDTALWWPGAFSVASQQRMQAAANLIAVPEDEAKKFACNAVVIDQKIILPEGCEVTMAACEKLQFTVLSCDMSEFLKSGGACKCLTFEL